MDYSPEDGDKMCRICMTEKKSLISIYDTTDNIPCDIPIKIMSCAKVEIQMGDLLPSKICLKCHASLNACYNFKILCENSDQLFRSSLQKASEEEDRSTNDDSEALDVVIKLEPMVDVNNDMEEIVEILNAQEKRTYVRRKPLKEYKCDPCQVKFKSRRDWVRHKCPKSAKKKCGTRTRSGTAASNSVTIKYEPTLDGNDNMEDFGMPVDDFLEATLQVKRSYVRRKPLKEHICENCGKHFKTRTELKRHTLRRHGVNIGSGAKKQECQICHLTFDSWVIYKNHQKESGHYAKFKCELCDKSFSRSYLSEHLRSHSGEQPFLCTICGRNFLLQSVFKKHSLRCSNVEKKIKCSYCDSYFYGGFALKCHERIHTKEKPYVCETCGKAFRLKTKLSVHQMTHTDARPHPCKTCGRKFRQRAHLIEHTRIHTGIKPFICGICGAGFTQGHSLKTHQIRHTPNEINSLN